MSAKRKPVEICAQDIATMAIKAKGSVISEAAPWVVDWLRKNPAWLDEHLEEICTHWAMKILGIANKGHREGARAAANSAPGYPAPVKGAFASALTEAVNANYSRMMDSTIWGGKKIADATPDEIRESARRYHENGKSMMREARFEFAIADAAEKNGAGSNEPVRNVLSPKTFEQLWEESDAA